ncbi:MAG TPA: isochorismatase family protein [Bacteroidales bacterium]|nr:isochorismatase family protein [Bacteroidales bacterium]
MKEKYFTADSIEEESSALIEEVKYYAGKRIFKTDIKHMALLVVDMQNYFLDSEEHAFIPSAPVILPNVIKLMEICKDHGVPTILTRHINTRNDAGLMGIRWHEVIRDEDPRSHLHKDIAAIGGEVMVKSQFDAFHNTQLEKRLKAAGVKQIIITGVMTNMCCETTARSAFVKGFEVIMPVDATAAYNYEFHLATFLNMAYMFSTPLTTRDLIASMNESL